MAVWTTSDLLTSVRNRQMFPDASTGSLSDTALLQYGTDELYITLLPVIMGVREHFYETYTDYDYTDATPSIAIPNRSIGNTISSVQYLYGQAITALNPMDPSLAWTTQATSSPSNFFFENNNVVFYPTPVGSYGTIRFRWFQRPNSLVATSACAQITAFDANTLVATCTPVSTWTTTNTFDFIPQTANKATPYALDSVASAISATDITFTGMSAADAALVQVGDWIALAGYTPVPEIPLEFQPALAQAICVRALGAINDNNAIGTAKADLANYLQGAVKLLTPRDQMGLKQGVPPWRML